MTVKSVLNVVFVDGNDAHTKVAYLSPDGMTLYVSWAAFFNEKAATRRKVIEEALLNHRTEALRRDLIHEEAEKSIKAIHEQAMAKALGLSLMKD